MSVPPFEAGADAHQAHAQEPLGGFDLERRQRVGEVFLPAPPVVVQRRAEFGQAHAAAHAPEAAQKPRHLGVVPAHDAVEIDHEHAILHVLNDEPVDLLEVRHVDAALGGQVLAGLRVAPERERDADGGKVAEPDEPGLEQLRAGNHTLEQAPGVEREQHRARQRGVKKRHLRAHQPAAGSELRKEQYRKRAAGGPARIDEQGEKEQVADQKREQQGGQRQQRRVALHPPQTDQAIDKIEPHRGDEGVGGRRWRSCASRRTAPRRATARRMTARYRPTIQRIRRPDSVIIDGRLGGSNGGIAGRGCSGSAMGHTACAGTDVSCRSPPSPRRAAGTPRSVRSAPSAVRPRSARRPCAARGHCAAAITRNANNTTKIRHQPRNDPGHQTTFPGLSRSSGSSASLIRRMRSISTAGL